MTIALALEGLTKTYKNGVEALKGIDLKVSEGDFFALLGPNGAGKSTIIGIVSSLVNKTQGRVQIGPYDLAVETSKAKALLGVMPQEINLGPFDQVSQVLLAQASFYGIPRKEAKLRMKTLLAILQLEDKANKVVRALSGGMKRRLMIARALIHQPRILVLDEPTAGVDVELRQALWSLLKKLNEEEGMTIILTTHYLEEAESLCKNLAIIDHGQIIHQGAMSDLLQTLQSEILLFDLAEPLETLPSLSHQAQLLTPTILQVEINKGECLNTLFTELLQADVAILSMRNAQNRLERLFLELTRKEAI